MIKNKTAALFLIFLVFFSCTAPPGVKEEAEIFPLDPGVEVPETGYVTIVAAGDNLYHNVMIRSGEEGDYESPYREILPLVEKADIAFINQETLLGGIDYGFTGYPRFNSPQKLGRAVAAAGFDVVNHATNHIMDKGEKAVIATMDFWNSIPQVTVLGIHRSEEERAIPRILKKNGITIGFLSYTYGTNGIPVPKDKPYLVSLINTEKMAEEIDSLRGLCEFLVVSMHWGEEYQHDANKRQQELAVFLAEHKVDLVIGHHPHVIQPVEYIKRPDGKNMLCFYSLGNFISAQTQSPTLLGALAYIKIGKMYARDETLGEISSRLFLTDAGAIPLVTHYENNYTNFKVYPLYAYTEELISKHRIRETRKDFTMDYLKGLAAKIFGGKEIPHSPFTPAITTPESGLYQ